MVGQGSQQINVLFLGVVTDMFHVVLGFMAQFAYFPVIGLGAIVLGVLVVVDGSLGDAAVYLELAQVELGKVLLNC